MQICTTIEALRAALANKKSAFVPTMGNLHAGHVALVSQAVQYKQQAKVDCVVSSIFVNRLQFQPHEDFDQYPRTWQADSAQLKKAGCDVLFAPSEAELYPEPQTATVHPPAELADILEGKHRPGFFIGVCTVVMKLLQCVQPTIAIFGKKDYQQLLIIRQMVRQFAIPTHIIDFETQRAASGLALSSRNGYLSQDQLTQAAQLKQAIDSIVNEVRSGNRQFQLLEQHGIDSLQQRAWSVDYLVVRKKNNLQVPLDSDPVTNLVVLAAAKLGATRLIDNQEID
jgi:pantoate--beta-alanine ligase